MRCKRGSILTLVLLLGAGITCAGAEKLMSVSVRETPLRQSPTFLGKMVMMLNYTDRVEVLEEKAGWARVVLSGREGWVHLSALSSKNIVLTAGDQNVEQSASSSEVALAGKGFNAQVEAEYSQDKGLDYTLVDQMEQVTVTAEDIAAFVQEGALNLWEGEE